MCVWAMVVRYVKGKRIYRGWGVLVIGIFHAVQASTPGVEIGRGREGLRVFRMDLKDDPA